MLDRVQRETPETIIQSMGKRARTAAAKVAQADRMAKDAALCAAAETIRARQSDILAANQRDIEAGTARGLDAAMLDRLTLDAARLEGIAAALEDIAELDDPVGHVLEAWERPTGLRLEKVAVPLGVIGVIYESRPNVTADAGALCLKAGNAVILRGGSEAVHSNRAIHAAMVAGLEKAGLPGDAIQLVPDQDRALVGALLSDPLSVDVIVPRGGKSLVARVQNEAKVPVFAHLEGLNHIFVDAAADLEKAVRVVANAKMRRTGICGAVETLLIDQSRLDDLGPIVDALSDAGCALRGDEAACAADDRIEPAAAEDWDTEYLAALLAVKTVDGLEGALAHIATHGSGHTDCIITEDAATADAFLDRVDSAIVMHNASTQFADGGEFGFGAEIGISTGRMHARGPVGVRELTTFKYKVRGNGTVRA